jgi:CheY-like chemotaxis protein
MTGGSARPLVLLVEDHADTRQMYAEFLALSFDIVEAANGEDALGVLRQRVPALVITDFSLPGIDGFELTRQVRDNPATRHVPVICLSGYGGSDHEARAERVGCNRVLEKPCLPDRLAQAAHDMVRRQPS